MVEAVKCMNRAVTIWHLTDVTVHMYQAQLYQAQLYQAQLSGKCSPKCMRHVTLSGLSNDGKAAASETQVLT